MPTNLAFNAGQNHLEKIDRAAKNKFKSRLRLELELAGIPQKALAYATNTDEGQLSRILNDKYEDVFPAHKLPLLTREMGPGVMEWLAVQCGGIYSHGAEPPLIEGSLATLVGSLAAQAGECVKQLIFVMESDHIHDKQEVIVGLRVLAQNIQSLLAHAEGRLAS